MSDRNSPIYAEIGRLLSNSKHILQMHKGSLNGLSYYLATDKSDDPECRGKVVALALSLSHVIETTRQMVEQAQELTLEFADDDDA